MVYLHYGSYIRCQRFDGLSYLSLRMTRFMSYRHLHGDLLSCHKINATYCRTGGAEKQRALREGMSC